MLAVVAAFCIVAVCFGGGAIAGWFAAQRVPEDGPRSVPVHASFPEEDIRAQVSGLFPAGTPREAIDLVMAKLRMAWRIRSGGRP